MGIRDLSQIVANINYFAVVVESSSQWERYTVVFRDYAIWDSRPGKGGPVILQIEEPESSCHKHICGDIKLG